MTKQSTSIFICLSALIKKSRNRISLSICVGVCYYCIIMFWSLLFIVESKKI